MKILSVIGYLLGGIFCVILGNLAWNVISVYWAEKIGLIEKGSFDKLPKP